MADFYHAPTCGCGNCQAEPGDGPSQYKYGCGCFFDDGEVYFCEVHDVEDYIETMARQREHKDPGAVHNRRWRGP